MAGNSSRTTSVHILDDDSLLCIISLSAVSLGEDEVDKARPIGGDRQIKTMAPQAVVV
jgi:hypothetical protein